MFGNNNNENGEKIKILPISTKPVPRKYLIICLIGLIIFTTGLMMVMSSHMLKDDYTNYNESISYRTSELSYVIRTIGIMFASSGIAVSIAGFLSAAFLSDGLDKNTRTALLGSGIGLLFMLLFFTLIYGLT